MRMRLCTCAFAFFHACSYSVGAFAARSPHIACGRVYLRRWRSAPRTGTHAHMHAQTWPPSKHARVCTTYALHAAHACLLCPCIRSDVVWGRAARSSMLRTCLNMLLRSGWAQDAGPTVLGERGHLCTELTPDLLRKWAKAEGAKWEWRATPRACKPYWLYCQRLSCPSRAPGAHPHPVALACLHWYLLRSRGGTCHSAEWNDGRSLNFRSHPARKLACF